MAGSKKDLILDILRERCAQVPERADGYRQELLGVIAEVVHAEREHLLRAIEIQKKVTGICERLGESIPLADHKGKAH